MIILRYMAVYFIVMLGSIFLADKFNKKVQNTIIIDLLLVVVCLYIFGILNLFNVGIKIVSIVSILLGIITIVKNIKRKTIKQLGEKIFSAGTIFFIIMFLIFIITTSRRSITHWDQFSYWSYATKDMYYTGKLAIQNSITIQYPPMPAILQVFFMRIIGEYSQGIEIFTTWILGISMLIPLFNKSNDKKIVNIAIGILCLCIPAVFSMVIFYESAYSDGLLGLFIGYISIVHFFEKDNKFKNLSLILSIIVVTIMKPTGFVISGIIVITFLIYEFMKNKRLEFIKLKQNIIIIILILIILLTYLSWNMYLKLNSINENNLVTITINEQKENKSIGYIINSLVTTILGINVDNYDAAQSNGSLITKIQNTIEIYTPIQISALGVICIYAVIFLLIYKYGKIESKEQNNKLKYMLISIFSGIILYILFLQVAYITKFSNSEMLNHDGFERYIGTYLLGILYIIVFIVLNIIKTKTLNNNLLYVILTAIIVMITPMNQLANATVTSGIYNINNESYLYASYEYSKNIKKNIEENSRILGICQKSEFNLINLMVRYYMYPIKYNVIDKIDNNTKSLENIIEEGKYEYVYITYLDVYLENIMHNYLENDEIKENTLYKVNNINGNIILERVS